MPQEQDTPTTAPFTGEASDTETSSNDQKVWFKDTPTYRKMMKELSKRLFAESEAVRKAMEGEDEDDEDFEEEPEEEFDEEVGSYSSPSAITIARTNPVTSLTGE